MFGCHFCGLSNKSSGGFYKFKDMFKWSLWPKKKEDQPRCVKLIDRNECIGPKFCPKRKVAVLGAAGNVGSILSLLLKSCPYINKLCLFDVDQKINGVQKDLSHIDTTCCVQAYCGMENICHALKSSNVVVIVAGVPKNVYNDTETQFNINAPIVAALAESCAKFCPEACVVIATSPLNSLVPVVAEVFKLACVDNKHKVFGLTTLESIRASSFVGEKYNLDSSSIVVPIIGGSSGNTLVPVFSQLKPACCMEMQEAEELTCKTRLAEEHLRCELCGAGKTSTLTTGYAGFRFVTQLLSAMNGERNVIDCAYVQSDFFPEMPFMTSPLLLGEDGIECNYGYPKLSDCEVLLLKEASRDLMKDIQIGRKWVEKTINSVKSSKLPFSSSSSSCKNSCPKPGNEKLPVKMTVQCDTKDDCCAKRRSLQSILNEAESVEIVICPPKGKADDTKHKQFKVELRAKQEDLSCSLVQGDVIDFQVHKPDKTLGDLGFVKNLNKSATRQ